MNDISFQRIAFASLLLAGILVYAKTITYPEFLFDGGLYLLKNPIIKDLGYYAQLKDIHEFSRIDEQLRLSPDVTTSFMLRPLTYLTFSINYLISGFNAAAYRSVNLAIHLLNALLVFACIELLLRFAPSPRSLNRFSIRFIPMASAMVFLLHPLQTESVTYITQRFTSFAAMFYLMTVWLYLRWTWRERQGENCGILRWSAVAVLLLGMLTRESLFTAPLFIAFLELTVLGNGLKVALRRAAPLLMLLPIIPAMVITVSAAQSSSAPSLLGAVNIVNYDTVPILHYALTQVVVVVTYLRLYLLPYGQNVDPDPPLYTLPYEFPVVIAGLTIVFMVGSTFYLYRKHRDDIRCVLTFVGTCWYFLAVSVSSSFIPLPDLMAEHRAYMASVGFILALVCLIDLLRTEFLSTQNCGLFLAGVVIWCSLLAVLTYKRNNLWQSGTHLWSDAVKKSPAKARPLLNLGIAHLTAGNYSEAQEYLQKSIGITPGWGLAYEMLATSHLRLKRYQEAVAVSLRGSMVDPANPVIYNNLGIAYAELGQNENAKQAFSTALDLLPGYKTARANLDMLESFMESNVGRRR